jgi:hypothetical protein
MSAVSSLDWTVALFPYIIVLTDADRFEHLTIRRSMKIGVRLTLVIP